jgi:hypothetical protein
LQLYFLFLDQYLPELLGLPLSLMDLQVAIVYDILVVALDDLGLDLLLDLVLLPLLLCHLALLLFLLVLL